MVKRSTDSGFSVVEALLILVIVGILGFTGWYIYHSKRTSDKSYSGANSGTPTYKKKASTTKIVTLDVYVGWTQYCSDYGGVCFKYPQGWQANSTETDESSVQGVTLVSPSGKIEIIYNPLVDGTGGVCEPNLCFFQPSSITKPAGNNEGDLKVVKGVYTNNDAQVIMPYYYVSDDNSIDHYGLSVRKNTDVGFFINSFTNPGRDGTEFLYVRGVNQPDGGYGSSASANTWLSGNEVVTAGKILSSIELK